MKIIEAINEVYSIEKIRGTKIFLAGGISNCPDWQTELLNKITETAEYAREYAIIDTISEAIDKLIVYNPRRKNFPIHDPNASEEQIVWEAEHLKSADILVFWFSRGSLNPIVLFELGRYGMNHPNVIIGIDPLYERKNDVIIQTKIGRPFDDIHFYDNIDDVAAEIVERVKYSG